MRWPFAFRRTQVSLRNKIVLRSVGLGREFVCAPWCRFGPVLPFWNEEAWERAMYEAMRKKMLNATHNEAFRIPMRSALAIPQRVGIGISPAVSLQQAQRIIPKSDPGLVNYGEGVVAQRITERRGEPVDPASPASQEAGAE